MITTRSVFLMSVQRIRHRATAECWGQTGHRRAVSNPRLVVEHQHPGAARPPCRSGSRSRWWSRSAREEAGGQPAVDRHAVVVLRDEVLVAVVLHQLGDAVERVVPGDRARTCRRPACGASDTSAASGDWTKSSSAAPFGQSVPRLTGWSGSPSIWMIVGLGVLRLVAQRVDDDAAGDRAVGAGVAGLGRALELEGPNACGERIARAGESQGANGRCGEASSAHLHELPTSDGHVLSPSLVTPVSVVTFLWCVSTVKRRERLYQQKSAHI